jgi:tryptophan 2,3-dioxygenase
MMMDEAYINHYGKSTAARVDKAFLIERDAAVLLPESFTSHRSFSSFPPILGPTSQFSKRFQLRMCECMLALKQQIAQGDHKIRGALASR